MLSGPCILLIENDDAVIQVVLRHLIDAFGIGVTLECASALMVAGESLCDTKFDAVLLDLSLASHSTCTAVPTIQSLAPDTPLFLLLDKSYQLQEVELSRLGPGGYLFKQELGEPDWTSRLRAAMLNRGGIPYPGHRQATPASVPATQPGSIPPAINHQNT